MAISLQPLILVELIFTLSGFGLNWTKIKNEIENFKRVMSQEQDKLLDALSPDTINKLEPAVEEMMEYMSGGAFTDSLLLISYKLRG